MDVAIWEQQEQTMALLKLLALGHREIEAGPYRGVDEVLAELENDAQCLTRRWLSCVARKATCATCGAMFVAASAHRSGTRAVPRCTRRWRAWSHPLAGHLPDELAALNLVQYQQVLVGMKRIIYELGDRTVYVHVVCDTRRDLRAVLLRRLLGAPPF